MTPLDLKEIKKEINEIPEVTEALIKAKRGFREIWNIPPTLAAIMYRSMCSAITLQVIGHYAKKDYFFGLVCDPDKDVGIAMVAEDRYEVMEKLLELNPHGWPQFIHNGMAPMRDSSPVEADGLARWMIACKVSEKELRRILHKIGWMSLEELYRRGLPEPYRSSQTEKEFTVKMEKMLTAAGM